METEQKSRKGFASMDKAKRQQIAGMGGRAAHMKGTAHEWTHEEARMYGAIGGRKSRRGARQGTEGRQGTDRQDTSGREDTSGHETSPLNSLSDEF